MVFPLYNQKQIFNPSWLIAFLLLIAEPSLAQQLQNDNPVARTQTPTVLAPLQPAVASPIPKRSPQLTNGNRLTESIFGRQRLEPVVAQWIDSKIATDVMSKEAFQSFVQSVPFTNNQNRLLPLAPQPVSYTHLTLPTILLV